MLLYETKEMPNVKIISRFFKRCVHSTQLLLTAAGCDDVINYKLREKFLLLLTDLMK
jgi:hypothetical protein